MHASDAVTGLIELADAGEIDLSFQLQDPSLRRPRGVWTLWLRLTTDALRDVGVCIDCHDAPEYFCPDSAAACLLYYKSNLREESYLAVPAEARAKLRPFGPYLPCRPQRDRAAALRWSGNMMTKLRHTAFISTRKRSILEQLRLFSGDIRRWRRHASRKTWREYEGRATHDFHDPPTILFNPSCWDESEAPSIRPMNEKRAELIVALRREFGDRFVGGFRNYGPSVARYPDAVERRSVPHDEYVRLLQASPITVYVNGKWGCYSWRLAENFAAGKGMVSERIVNDAGFSLDENAGIVQCATVDAMVSSLRELCSSPSRLQELSENSRNTYVERLRPHARMRRILAEVVAAASPQASAAPATERRSGAAG